MATVLSRLQVESARREVDDAAAVRRERWPWALCSFSLAKTVCPTLFHLVSEETMSALGTQSRLSFDG